MLRSVLTAAAAFAAMELGAYVLHRFVFHGPLWRVHRTHHEPGHRHGPSRAWRFEANDLFSAGFAVASMGLLWAGRADPLASPAFAVGAGVAAYGVLYFVLHDLYAHGRFVPFRTRNAAAQAVKRAHGRHHRSLDKPGQEPYGLFLFPPSFGRRVARRRDAGAR